ncbi:MAG: hypothetical protein ABSF56_01960 [Minisyncoccia bacterium]|jgi:UDP-glucose 6-dehydrogenase
MKKPGKSGKPLIGFIGQGWVGRSYADDFEARGHAIVRYGLEAPHKDNKAKIALCDIVFIAVPTPTTPQGFDDSAIRAVLPLVGKGRIAVIKSTLVMGRTKLLQKAHPDILLLHSPEFLSESTAAHDAANPHRNIIGIPRKTEAHRKAAEIVLAVLPKSPYEMICSSDEAEFIKYSHNVHGYIQVVFSNILYDLAKPFGLDWETLSEAIKADPMMSHHRYMNPVHKKGRGAGGHCFIKDFEAFVALTRAALPDKKTIAMLEAIRDKNIDLLLGSGKDVDLLEGVYGKAVTARRLK